MPIGQFGILCYRHTAVMVVIAQRYIYRCSGPQAFEKTKEMRQALRHIEQISCNENPIWAELLHSGNNRVMPRVISIKMEIGQVNGTTTSEKGMVVSEDGDFMIGQAPLPMWCKAEDSV